MKERLNTMLNAELVAHLVAEASNGMHIEAGLAAQEVLRRLANMPRLISNAQALRLWQIPETPKTAKALELLIGGYTAAEVCRILKCRAGSKNEKLVQAISAKLSERRQALP